MRIAPAFVHFAAVLQEKLAPRTRDANGIRLKRPSSDLRRALLCRAKDSKPPPVVYPTESRCGDRTIQPSPVTGQGKRLR